MRKPLLTVSSLLLLLLLGLAGCAHQGAGGGAGYAGGAYGDCEFGEDCYGPYNTTYTCVFYQTPSMPARLAIAPVQRHHPSPRVVDRDWSPGTPSTDSSGNANAPSAAPAPSAPIAREPVVQVSPPGGSRSPRTPN
jgi:hypothetical protein